MPAYTYRRILLAGEMLENTVQRWGLDATDFCLDLSQDIIETGFEVYDRYSRDFSKSLSSADGADKPKDDLELLNLEESSNKKSVRFFRKREHRHLEIKLYMLDVGMVSCV